MSDPKDPPPEPQSRAPYQYVSSDRSDERVACEMPADIGIIGRVALGASLAATAALVALLVISAPHGHFVPKSKMEKKQVGDIMSAFQLIQTDSDSLKKMKKLNAKEKGGHDFYEWAIRRGLLDKEILGKIISLGTRTDSRADADIFKNGGSGVLPANACSYTSPRAGELLDLLEFDSRTVLVTFNSRNWNNYPDDGVLVAWSEGNVIEYMTFEDASDAWGITRAEWDDPAGKLFGKKAPFQHTYE